MWSDITRSYHDVITHVTPGPNNISYPIAMLLLPGALLIPPSVLTHRQLYSLFMPIIYGLLLRSWSQMHGIDVLSVDLALWSFNLLVFRDPRATFKRVWVKPAAARDSDGGGKDHVWDEPYPSKLSARIPWVFSMVVSFRYLNWKIGDPRHDRTQPPQTVARSAYLKTIIINVLSCYVLMDLACSYVQIDPYFFRAMSIDTPFPPLTPKTPAIFALLQRLPPRLVRSAILAAQIYSAVRLMFTLPCLMVVPLGILPDEWSPHTWPAFFGPFSAVWESGLRGLWGTWWHQQNRHIMSTPGRAFNKLLCISSTSTVGYASLTISAFFFSGIIHMGLVPPEPPPSEFPVYLIRLNIGLFFWVQALGFGIELVATRLFRGVSQKVPPMILKVFVLIWTAGWLSLTLPLFARSFLGLKYWDIYPLPTSIIQGLSGNGWLRW